MRPNKLAIGDEVIIVSPAGRVNQQKIEIAAKQLEAWGLKVHFGNHAFSIFNKLAGTDANRLSDLQQAMDNPKIKAIFCSRGGYGLVRIIDKLELTAFINNPKWIVGFSDVTVLHNHVHRHTGIATLHAPMPNSYDNTPEIALNSIKKALFTDNYQLDIPLQKEEIVGGNLAIVYSLLGTNSDIITDNKVLFLEEIGEYAYNIDRMIHGLKKAGKFEKLKGLLIGQFTETKDDDFGFTVQEIIENCTQEYDFPIYYNIPAGHVEDNRAMVLGK